MWIVMCSINGIILISPFSWQGQNQVWLITLFYSVDFSQSRIGVKKCVFNKRTKRGYWFELQANQLYFLQKGNRNLVSGMNLSGMVGHRLVGAGWARVDVVPQLGANVGRKVFHAVVAGVHRHVLVLALFPAVLRLRPHVIEVLDAAVFSIKLLLLLLLLLFDSHHLSVASSLQQDVAVGVSGSATRKP